MESYYHIIGLDQSSHQEIKGTHTGYTSRWKVLRIEGLAISLSLYFSLSLYLLISISHLSATSDILISFQTQGTVNFQTLGQL